MENKTCKRCKSDKPISEFDKMKRQDEYYAYCRKCWAEKYIGKPLVVSEIKDLDGEVWKDIVVVDFIPKGCYQVSNMGRVKSLKRSGFRNTSCRQDKLLNYMIDRDGYYRVRFGVFGKAKTYLVSRLVATYFIPNPENKPTVNHKWGVKMDNRASELEWATHSENEKHSYDVLGKTGSGKGKIGSLHHSSIPVIQLTLDGKFVAKFGSAGEAQLKTGIRATSISNVRTGLRIKAGGYKWIYAEKYKVLKTN